MEDKAKQRALEKYPTRSVRIVPARGGGYYADSHLREGFIEGYHQAEKDMELTWEDCAKIDDIAMSLYDLEEVRDMPNKEFYTEVLKRFKLQKGE